VNPEKPMVLIRVLVKLNWLPSPQYGLPEVCPLSVNCQGIRGLELVGEPMLCDEGAGCTVFELNLAQQTVMRKVDQHTKSQKF